MDCYDEKIPCEMKMEIEKIKEKIIESYNPERIILFSGDKDLLNMEDKKGIYIISVDENSGNGRDA